MADIKDPENTLVVETSKGTVVIEMRPDLAPNHVAHIKKLVREKFYDGIVFHRVIDGFMAQTGDPTGILGRLTLGVVKIGRHSDNRFGHRLTEEIF